MNSFKRNLCNIPSKVSFFIGTVALTVAVTAGCMTADVWTGNNWPMYKYNVERTGSTSNFGFEAINQLWKYDFEIFEEGGGSRISAAVCSDRVFIPTRYYFSCLNADNGNLIWRKYIGENYSSPIIYEGSVIISSSSGIYSFNIKDGSATWTRNLPKEDYITPGLSTPCAVNNHIYYGFRGKDDSEGYLYCIDARDGTTVWRSLVAGPVRTSPLVTNDKVMFGSDDGNLYCLDAHSGAFVWNYFAGEKIRSSPAVHDKLVCFGCNNAYIYCLNIDSGTLMWKFKTEDANTATPAIADGKVFISSSDKYLYCLDITNGKQIWEYDIGNSTYTSPSIVSDKILLGLENEIHCLDAESGSPIWIKSLEDSGASTPLAIYDRKVFFRTTSFVFCFTLD